MGCSFLFADRLRVSVHRGSHVGMPQQFLLHFHVDAELPLHGAVGVPKRMPTQPAAKPSGCCGWLYVVRQCRS
jgi:hypothetical protein